MSKKVLVVFLSCVVPILGLSAQPKQAEEPLYGTWVNEEYGTRSASPQKCVWFPDGRELDYMLLTDKEPHWENKFWIEDQSIDQEGNYWYKIRVKTWYYGYPQTEENIFGDGYSLVQIDASGTRFEGIWAGSRMPDEEDWGLMPHGVWYRQK